MLMQMNAKRKREDWPELLRLIAEPVKWEVLVVLLTNEATVSELVHLTGKSQPNISNHLKSLRDAGLVASRKEGRKRIYRIGNPLVASAIESLLALRDTNYRPTAAMVQARTCYDHLAGRLGVRVFESLWEQGMMKRVRGSESDLHLTERGSDFFSELGVALDPLHRQRRRFAFRCRDWTEKRSHLGGALGAALCDLFFQRSWITRTKSNRSLKLCPAGKRVLATRFQIDLADLT